MDETTLQTQALPESFAPNPILRAYHRLGKAERYRQAKLFDKAQAICTELIEEYPDYVGALLTLGVIQSEAGQYEAARVSLSRAAMLNPSDWQILNELARVYRKLSAAEMAMRTLEQAHRLNPKDPRILLRLAKICQGEGEHELAEAANKKALALDPSLAAARIGLASSLNQLCRYEEMIEVLGPALRQDPDNIEALYALSQMPAKYFHLDLLKKLDEIRANRDQVVKADEFENTLAFARAAALDKGGRYQEAWQELTSVNSRMFQRLAEQSTKNEQAIARLLELTSRMTPVTQAALRREAPCRSLFILGPSRSGKSTMERLLGCVPGVRLGNENPIVENAIRRTFQSAGLITSQWLVDLPAEFNELFCQNYLTEFKERARGALILTNTYTQRIRDAARLALTVPGVRLLFIKRDPYDVALRIYMRQYLVDRPHTYDLTAILRYIEWYQAMVDEITRKVPGISSTISYEDMVADPRSALAHVADFCGLMVPDVEIPEIGDDRGAATPYRQAMDAALAAS